MDAPSRISFAPGAGPLITDVDPSEAVGIASFPVSADREADEERFTDEAEALGLALGAFLRTRSRLFANAYLIREEAR